MVLRYPFTPLLHTCTPLWSLLITVSPPDALCSFSLLLLWKTLTHSLRYTLESYFPTEIVFELHKQSRLPCSGPPLFPHLSSLCAHFILFYLLTVLCVFLPFLHACMLSPFSLCPAVCEPMDCSPPASSVYEILQARILVEWVAKPSSRGPSWPRDRIHVSYISSIGKWVLY